MKENSNKLIKVLKRTGQILGTITCSLMICLSIYAAIYNHISYKWY
jgi:hypothetical protein